MLNMSIIIFMLDTEFVDLFDTFYIDVEDIIEHSSISFFVNLIQVSKNNLFDIFSESYLKI